MRDGVRHEPRLALVAEQQGMALLRRLVHEATQVLRPSGWLVLEHGSTLGAKVRSAMQACGYGDVCSPADLAGHERVSMGQWRAENDSLEDC